jgi:phosphoglycolate phosphatase-like HAD superfamily hydrolase
MEIINQQLALGKIRHALFDFDGTISLIRAGWQEVMLEMMFEILIKTPTHESEKALSSVIKEFITRLTGKQTIYQMIQLREEVEKRGGEAKEPLEYKHHYHDLLMKKIQYRLEGLKKKEIESTGMMVPGTMRILELLKNEGVVCYLASGTDEKFVIEEAELLGVTHYFASIYGAQDDYKNFSKRMVIQRIIRENRLKGDELVAFGDGFVEIEDTKMVGGIAIGVATNEESRIGINQWKRRRLIQAGADIIIPDFRESEKLVEYLFQEA